MAGTPYVENKGVTHAWKCSVRPARRALRGARRSDDHRADGCHHQDLGHLRLRFRPLAIPRHQPDRPADPDGARVLRHCSKGPAEHFTGSVQIEPLFFAHDPSRTSGGKVTFEPGARSAWHTHPLGQILIVTDGTGWIQQWGGPIQEIRTGDVIWIPAGVKHWHGATPNTSMTHIAIQEQLNGKAVEWMEKVTDEQYRK